MESSILACGGERLERARRAEPPDGAASAISLGRPCAASHRCCRGGRIVLLQLGSNRATHIVELDAAVAAMVQICPEKILDCAEHALVHRIDAVARRHMRQPIGVTFRTSRMIAQIEGKPARLRPADVALTAFIHRPINKSFDKAAMNAPETASASRTIEHVLLYFIHKLREQLNNCKNIISLRSPTKHHA